MRNTLKTLNKSVLLALMLGNSLAFADCLKPSTQFEEKDCQYQEYLTLKAKLDIEFKSFSSKTIKLLDESSKNKEQVRKKLLESQNTWKKYVKTHCDLAALLDNNNSAQNELACEADLIQQRIQTLRNSPF